MADADGSVVIVFDSDVSDAEKKIGRLKTEIQNLKTEISEKEFKHDTISEQAGAMEAKINDAKKAVADYEQELISIQTKIGKTPTTGEGNRAEYQQLHKQYDIIEQKLAAQRETVKNLEPEWEKLVNSADKLAASIQEDEQSLAALRYAGGELTKQVDAEKSTDGEADEAAHLKEISESAVVANQHVVDLQQELSDLKARQMELQAAGVGLGYEEFDGIAVRINEINQELREYRASLSEIGQEDGETAAEAASLREIGESAAVSNPQIVQLRQELEQLKARQAELKAAGLGFGYEEFDSNAAKIAQLNSTLREYESSVTRAADSETEAGSAANSMGASTDALKEKMGGGLKSVLTYGLGIRSLFALFNKMRSAIKEGFQNLAQADSTTSNSISALTGSLTQLKNSLATAFTPIVSVVAPILTTLINLLSKAATYVGMFFAALSGQKTFTKATAVQEDYAASLEGTTSAAKEAKQQLSGLDEINTWQSDSSGGGSSGTSVSDMFETVEIPSSFGNLIAILDPIIQDFQDFAAKIAEITKEWVNGLDFGSLKAAFANLVTSIEPLISLILDGLAWGYENVLLPLAGWTIEATVPALLDLLSGAFDLLTSTLEAFQPLGEWLWNHFLLPIGQWTGEAFIGALSETTELLHDFADLLSGGISFSEFISNLSAAQTLLLGIATALGTISVMSAGLTAFESIKNFAESVKKVNAAGLIGKIAGAFSMAAAGNGSFVEKINNLGEAFKMVFGPGSIIAGVAAVISGAVLAFTNFFSMLQNGFSWLNEALMVLGVAIVAVGAIILGAPALITAVIAGIVTAVATLVVAVVTVVKEHWEEIKAIWNTVAAWFDENVIQPLGVFFSELWETIKQVASECWEGIKAFFSPAIEWFSELFGSIWETVSDVFYDIGVIASGCWEIIKVVWDIVASWFDENVIQPVAGFFSDLWGDIVDAASQAWESIKTVFGAVANFFGNIFSAAWEKVVKVFSIAGEIFTDIKDGILTAFKFIVNGIIAGLNSIISVPFSGINNALRKIRDINILGLTPFSSLRTISVPQIPYLAQGAVIPPNREFMAVLGDQKHGTNIEAPLATIEEAVENVLRRNGYSGNGKNQYNVTVNARGKQLLQIILEEGRSQQMQSGSNPFLLGQGG